MSLSPTSFEILSDLLELRLEAFLVTSSDEARELKTLRQAQRELSNLQNMAREMKREMALPAPSASPPQPKVSRRLQRLIAGLQQDQQVASA